MDVPNWTWLRAWFVINLLGVLGTAVVVSGAVNICLQKACKTADWSHPLVLAISYVIGLLGTPVLSYWRGDFTFTWLIPPFIAFALLVWQSRQKIESRGRCRWQQWVAAAFFVSTLLAYFLICRRLSLLTHLAFLWGFLGALPLLYWGYKRSTRWRRPAVAHIATLCASFIVFYWSAVALMMLKYEIPP